MAKDTIDLYEHYLNKWSRTRGPLFTNPILAICRICALVRAMHIASECPDEEVKLRALRVVSDALSEVPDSNMPAGRADRARVNLALVDIRRLMRDVDDSRNLLNDYLAIFQRALGSLDADDRIHAWVWANLLCALHQAESDALQLRAARTLLAKTRDLARRVGRVRPQSEKPPPASPGVPGDETQQLEKDAPVPGVRDGSDVDGSVPAGAHERHASGATTSGRDPP